MPIPLLQAWAVIKKYWWVAAAIIGFILFKRWMDQSSDLAKTLADIQKAHEEEIAKIKAADEERRAASEANLRKMQERLDAIEKQYEAAQRQLDATKKAEIQAILKEDHDDPDALAKKLSEATGFKVILPS
jgi:Tfp pilus assembly protein PilO